MFDFLKSPGKMSISVEKMHFAHGETVKGMAKLDMSSSKEANGVKVKLYAVRKVPARDSKGRRTTRTETVYDFEAQLDCAHTYSGASEYPFELLIPGDGSADMPDGALGKVAEMASFAGNIMGVTAGPPEWFIQAWLDVPKGRDVEGKIEIQVA